MKLTQWLLVLSTLCALALVHPQVFGQEQVKPIVVSPLIGDTLDAAERETYRLLPNLSVFEWAVFYLNPDSSLMVKVSLLQNGVRRDTIISGRYTLTALQNHLRRVAEGNPATEIYRDLQTRDKLRQLAERAAKSEKLVKQVYIEEQKGKAAILSPLLSNKLSAQDSDKVVIVSPRVGPVIDTLEREHFHLFKDFKGFGGAVFFQTPRDIYYALVVMVDEYGNRQDTIDQYSKANLLSIGEMIDHFEDFEARKYRIGENPAKLELVEGEAKSQVREELSGMVKEFTVIRQATAPQAGCEVVVLLTDGQEVEGELVSIRDSSVLMAVEAGDVPPALSIGIEGLLAIKDTMISRVVVKGRSRVLRGMGLGVLGGVLIVGLVTGPRAQDETGVAEGIAGGVGMILGALVGAAVGAINSESDIEINLSVPAERSAFKKLARYPDKEPQFLQVIK